MPSNKQSTINLGLPDIPETNNAELFREVNRIYNAINLLAQSIDIYTQNGDVTTLLTTLQTNVSALQTSNTTIIARLDAIQANTVLPTAAIDLATTITLVNAIRTVLITADIGA